MAPFRPLFGVVCSRNSGRLDIITERGYPFFSVAASHFILRFATRRSDVSKGARPKQIQSAFSPVGRSDWRTCCAPAAGRCCAASCINPQTAPSYSTRCAKRARACATCLHDCQRLPALCQVSFSGPFSRIQLPSAWQNGLPSPWLLFAPPFWLPVPFWAAALHVGVVVLEHSATHDCTHTHTHLSA